MLARRSVSRTLVLVAVVAALTLGFAASAFAVVGPQVPIMPFGELREALEDSPLEGHMLTVVGEGSQEPTSIPLTVVAVPPTGSGTDRASLITFDAKGPLMAKYGGVVAGMSGSPVYVHTGDGDKLVGAVSYGDMFTLGGRGLATPIEGMARIESYPESTDFIPLGAPVITSGGVINRIIVAPNPEDYSAAAATGAFVAKPLASVFIGGLDPNSKAYKTLSKRLTNRGIAIVPITRALDDGSGTGTPFSTEMTAGASFAALASRGDLWMGGVGTCTYVNGDNVLAFGHPAYWSGATDLYMANAYVESVWPSSYEPYKVADPGEIKGTITQDRWAGVLGKLDRFSADTTITAHAIDADTHEETSSAVYIPRALLRDGFADGSLVAMATYMAGYNLYDQYYAPGSAHTTITVEVSDGTDLYTVSIPNYSDSSDVPYTAINDVYLAISRLQSVIPFGLQDLQILSVDLTGTYSAHRHNARLVGVKAPKGLHVGANRVTVEALEYGVEETQTVDATVTIPTGVSLTGSLVALAINSDEDDYMGYYYDDYYTSPSRQTIAQIVSSLNKTEPDTAFKIGYMPGMTQGSSEDDGYFYLSSNAIGLTTVQAPWPVKGSAGLNVASITAKATPATIPWGGYTDIVGSVSGPATATVSLYAKTAGSSTETLIATQTAAAEDMDEEEYDEEEGIMSGAVFDFELDEVHTNTTYRVQIDPVDDWSGAEASVLVRVKAVVSLTSSASRIRPGRTVKLTARVFPGSATGGTVVFEQLVGRSWRTIATRTLSATLSYAKASYTWKPGKGTRKVRVRYLGGMKNYANSSSTKTITVK